ncbi:hypothetical protein [Variovorax paradoxus]|uniref:hypothetical protein n=1 Tax=Variovorax paradoxus TaxID=34073 RepID=UPI001E33B273|nr:hypothetical protein [Variovorax paradoxus]
MTQNQSMHRHAFSRRRLVQGWGLAALPVPWSAFATDYPNKPIELIVPVSAGGGTDALARVFFRGREEASFAAPHREQQARCQRCDRHE